MALWKVGFEKVVLHRRRRERGRREEGEGGEIEGIPSWTLRKAPTPCPVPCL